jgi:pantothenate kinase
VTAGGELAGVDLAPLLDRLAGLVEPSRERRVVVGVAGAPGAGKTTLVLSLLQATTADARLAGRVAHVPMDGFHLPNAALDRLGRRDRKGAPDTFDVEGYAAVLAALREVPRREVLAPSFDHAVGEPVADDLLVPLEADLVVSEGNYLLLPDDGWSAVRAELDECWYCAPDPVLRRRRLIARHVEAGRSLQDATAWVDRSDEANARLVEEAAAWSAADLVLVDGRISETSQRSPD